MTLEDMAAFLLLEFDGADTNNDNLLTMAEAQAALGQITQADFDQIDTNSDGFLSQAELTAVGEGGPIIGCPLSSGAVEKNLGDLFLLGTAILGLLAMDTRRRME